MSTDAPPREIVIEREAGVLADSRVVYLIVYVRDVAESRAFYEGGLGLRVVEDDADSCKLDAGSTILLLNSAAAHRIELPPRRDEASCDVVFRVDDVDATRGQLEARGVQSTRARVDGHERVTELYDPNGHHLVLRESARASARAPDGGDMSVASFVVSVPDADASREFFERRLGLRALAGADGAAGSADYDTGGLILSTRRHAGADAYDPTFAKGIAPVFHVPDAAAAAARLADASVRLADGVFRSPVGGIAKFAAPSGHLFYLYEPSAAARQLPSWESLARILGGNS